MKLRAVLIVAICAVLITPLSLRAQTPGPNLLADGDFEALDWPLQDGVGGVQIAPGWRAWYVDNDRVPSYVKLPDNCDSLRKTDCYWMRPEFHQILVGVYPNRVHSGIRAQQYFSYGRMHEAGLYQRFVGVAPNSTLRFSIFMQAWQCANSSACGKNGARSDAPADMHLRVGIDPYGGTDPFSGNIVWSPENEAFDRWVEFAVEAKAQSDAVTVFTHSRAEWTWPRVNNDVYLDDASLTVIGQGQPGTATTTQAVAGTPRPTITPLATLTPRPDGAVIHVVQAGDTMYGISLQYGVPLGDLYKLNNLTNTSVLKIGQEIVVKVGSGTVVAQATQPAQATTTFTSLLTPTIAPPTATQAPPTATPIPSGLCLSAFDDLNNNTLLDSGEPGLAGVTFVVLSGGTEIARYVSDDSGKPNCLTELPPGAYSVEVTPPTGYIAALDKADVALVLGQRVDLVVPARRGENATPTMEPATPTAQAPAAQGAPIRATATAIVIAALAILFAALVAISIAVIRRRRLR